MVLRLLERSGQSVAEFCREQGLELRFIEYMPLDADNAWERGKVLFAHEIIEKLSGTVPILGVCLGHQSLGQAFGGEVVRARTIMHGKTSPIRHTGVGVFAGIPDPFEATRYHSLVVRKESLPDCLEITAWTDDGEIMGLQHRSRPIHGVQFHPESIATEGGHKLLGNFLELAARARV